MFRRLVIRSFKSIAHADLQLGALNVFVGANGAGKSAVLEALGYLSAAAYGSLDQETVHARGLRYGEPDQVVCALAGFGDGAMEIEARNDQAAYSAGLGRGQPSSRQGWHYAVERIQHRDREWMYRDSKNVKVVRETPQLPMSLAAPLPTEGAVALVMALSPPPPVAGLLAMLRDYRVYSFSTPILRGRSNDPWPRDPLGLGGSQLSTALGSFQDEALRTVVRDALCELIDWVGDVYGKGEGRGRPGERAQGSQGANFDAHEVEFLDRFMRPERSVISATEASEGALHVLATLVALLHPRTPRCFGLDSLDTALNPLAARALVRKLQELLSGPASDRQLFVTAHNPAVLDGLNLADPSVALFAVDRTAKGQTQIRRVDYAVAAQKAVESGATLSELWLTGAIGGVPNV